MPSPTRPLRRRALAALPLLLLPSLPGAAAEPAPAAAPVPTTPRSRGADEDPELEALLAAERAEADRLRRTGEVEAALRLMDEHLRDDPDDAASLLVRARCRFEQGRFDRARSDAERVLELLGDGGERELRASAARHVAETHLVLGEAEAALAALEERAELVDPAADPRDAWVLGRALELLGRRREARDAFRAGARVSVADSSGPTGEATGAATWRELYARAHCEWRLGAFERASRSLVEADRVAAAGEGPEADVLAALGDLYFEVYREVEDPGGNRRSVREQYDEALRIAPGHERALVGLFELHRYNWRRRQRSADDLLAELLAVRPDSIPGLLAGLSADLDDGQLVRARERLARLEELAPARREVRTERAALAWIEHRRDDARAVLAALAGTDPADSRPERELGRHLCELYRFGEAVEFLRSAVERDPSDPEAWTQLGRALANTGDERAALEALGHAVDAAGGRRDAWRSNMRSVLQRLEDEYVEETFDDLQFVWSPDEADLLRAYLPTFYGDAREDLARRYGHTPGRVRIEVFRRHQDFSVRSTGFEGFPATGVCFGPVVTAISPICEMRGSFSWARTSFHEFSHVIHLGLSHNRCPRWITEGLATWEEAQRNPTWTRNMRRDLLDARANGAIIPVRDLNRAFRGSRILFGYYQGGLLCEMLIGEHGFAPMVRLLEAFDRGLDVDQALAEVFATTPEEVDRRFLAFVDAELGGLALEPRWDPLRAAALRLRLPRRPPAEPEALERWLDDRCTIAWSAWQSRGRVDAEEALRMLGDAADRMPRALFLRAEMALQHGDRDAAGELWDRAFELGGEDYRARFARGTIAAQEGDRERAIEELLAAERAFPGFPDDGLSAELELARLYEAEGETDAAMRARERWLRWNSGDDRTRLTVARWHDEAGRFAEAVAHYRGASEVDPFQRELHRRWGLALRELDRHAEALREFRVALSVPPELDGDLWRALGPMAPRDPRALARLREEVARRDPAPGEREAVVEELLGLDGERRAERRARRVELIALEAATLLELGRPVEAGERARSALELDEECELARGVLEELP